MKVLADENLDAPVVRWLRERGHDVLWVAESDPGADDARVIDTARVQQRIVITFDRDFGDLVFRQRHRPPGLILLRVRTSSAPELLQVFKEVWPVIETRVSGHFVVVSRRKVRIRPLPPSSF